MNGHVVATTLGQMTGLIIASFFILGILLFAYGVFSTIFVFVWAIVSLPFKILFSIVKFIVSPFFRTKKKTKEIVQYDEQRKSRVQQGVIETKDYIGLLTKIDKEKIAKDYLAEQRRKKYGRKK